MAEKFSSGLEDGAPTVPLSPLPRAGVPPCHPLISLSFPAVTFVRSSFYSSIGLGLESVTGIKSSGDSQGKERSDWTENRSVVSRNRCFRLTAGKKRMAWFLYYASASA